MGTVADEIRDYFYWVGEDEWIYLIMDKAGGHGKREVVDAYKAMLETRKIKIIHQIPNSPETNLLDLGVWRSLQSHVERIDYRYRQDADVLAKTVKKAWQEFSPETIRKVYERWIRVLDLIKVGDGGNRFVEAVRGQLTSDPQASQEEKDAAFQLKIEEIRATMLEQNGEDANGHVDHADI